jgi:hypothetical protein
MTKPRSYRRGPKFALGDVVLDVFGDIGAVEAINTVLSPQQRRGRAGRWFWTFGTRDRCRAHPLGGRNCKLPHVDHSGARTTDVVDRIAVDRIANRGCITRCSACGEANATWSRNTT